MSNSRRKSIQVGQEIHQTTINIGLELKINAFIPLDGNCWWESLIDQLKRPDVRRQNEQRLVWLNNIAREKYSQCKSAWDNFPSGYPYLTPFILRQMVCDYVLQYTLEEFGSNASDTDFGQMLHDIEEQRKDHIWAEDQFCEATTEVLQMPIRITHENSTAEEPFRYLTHKFSQKIPIIIGHQTNYHFQSLWPKEMSVRSTSLTTISSPLATSATTSSTSTIIGASSQKVQGQSWTMVSKKRKTSINVRPSSPKPRLLQLQFF